MAGYNRQEIFTDGDVILAEHGNNEFNQIESAFDQSTGHRHDGTIAEGGYVPLISDSGNINKVEVVAGGAKTTGTHQVTGLLTADSGVSVTGNVSVTGTVDGRDVSVDGAKLDTVEAGATADQSAAEVPFAPTGRVTATDVQSAVAQVSADIATQIAERAFYNEVIDVNFAASPFTVTEAHDGAVFQINTSGGPVVMNLPNSTGLTKDVRYAFVKWTGDANAITINRAGTDLINGLASISTTVALETIHIISDRSDLEWIANSGSVGTINADQVVVVPTGGLVSTNAQAAFAELDGEINGHIGSGGSSNHPDATGVTSGFMSSTDKTKLDGIESGATADQTAGEIKTLYESNANTNAFTDAEQTKLAGIEAGATADQTAGEIKTLYESNANTNAFTDAEQTKLAGIEAGATADQTAGEILTDLLTVDGAGSALDADLLDGQHGSFYQNASNLNAGTVSTARLPVASETASGIVEKATQSEMDAGTADKFPDAAAILASTILNPLKAKVIFAGADGTISAQKNVTSVSRVSAGVYDITFTNALADANYIICGYCDDNSGTIIGDDYIGRISTDSKTTSGFRMRVVNSTGASNIDSAIVGLAILS